MALAVLARVAAVRGDTTRAVSALEHAVQLPGAAMAHHELLTAFRKRLAPTVVSYASIDALLEVGSETPLEIDGISMVPTLIGQSSRQDQHEILYWEFQKKRALRMGDWKTVQPDGHDGPLELYNLKNDIGETQNLSTRHPEIPARIKEIMKESRVEPSR